MRKKRERERQPIELLFCLNIGIGYSLFWLSNYSLCRRGCGVTVASLGFAVPFGRNLRNGCFRIAFIFCILTFKALFMRKTDKNKARQWTCSSPLRGCKWVGSNSNYSADNVEYSLNCKQRHTVFSLIIILKLEVSSCEWTPSLSETLIHLVPSHSVNNHHIRGSKVLLLPSFY